MIHPFTLPVPSSIVLFLLTFISTVEPPEDDFSPILFLFVLLGGVIMLMLVGTGAVLAICAVIVTVLSLGFGVLSVSVLAGYLNKSITTGIKTFFLLLSGFLGIPVGIAMVFVLQWLRAGEYPEFLSATVLPGVLTGLLGGLIIGFVLLKAAGFLKEWLVARFRASGKAA